MIRPPRWTRRLFGRLAARLPAVHADLAPVYAAAPTLAPARPDGRRPRISMARERVEVELYRDRAVVFAVFEMKNHDEALDLDVAFPSVGGRRRFPAFVGGPLEGFVATAGGGALWSAPIEEFGEPSTHIHPEDKTDDAGEYPAWKVWRQRFARGVTVVKVRYACQLGRYVHGGRTPFTYVLRTGGYWHGPIGEAVVRVRAMGIPLQAIREAHPAGYTVDADDRSLTWRFVDLDPQADISLLVSQRLSGLSGVRVVPESVVGFNSRRPALGERVLVGGTLQSAQPADRTDLPPVGGPQLVSERWWDDNIVVPRGMIALRRSVPEEAQLMCTPIRIDDGTDYEGDRARPWTRNAWVIGAVAEVDGRIGIAAEAIYCADAARAFRPIASASALDGYPPLRRVDGDVAEGELRAAGWLLPPDGQGRRRLRFARGITTAVTLPPPDAVHADGGRARCRRPLALPSRSTPPPGAPVVIVGVLTHRVDGPHIEVSRLFEIHVLEAVPGSGMSAVIGGRHPWLEQTPVPDVTAFRSAARWPADAVDAGHGPRWEPGPPRVDDTTTPADLSLVPHTSTPPGDTP